MPVGRHAIALSVLYIMFVLARTVLCLGEAPGFPPVHPSWLPRQLMAWANTLCPSLGRLWLHASVMSHERAGVQTSAGGHYFGCYLLPSVAQGGIYSMQPQGCTDTAGHPWLCDMRYVLCIPHYPVYLLSGLIESLHCSYVL